MSSAQQSPHVVDLTRLTQQQYQATTAPLDGLICDQLVSTLLAWHNHGAGARLIDFGHEIYGLLGVAYETSERFMTLAGNTKNLTPALAQEIVTFARTEHCKRLSFLSKTVAETLSTATKLESQCLPKSRFDYIYQTEEQSALEGGKFQTRRRINRLFEKAHQGNFTLTVAEGQPGLGDPAVQQLFDDWKKFDTEGSQDNEEEKHAFQAFKTNPIIGRCANLVTLSLHIDNQLAAFVVIERMGATSATCHFQKCNLDIHHANDYFFWLINKFLKSKGRTTYNFQEDDDIQGLTIYKHRLRPSSMTEKFLISL